MEFFLILILRNIKHLHGSKVKTLFKKVYSKGAPFHFLHPPHLLWVIIFIGFLFIILVFLFAKIRKFIHTPTCTHVHILLLICIGGIMLYTLLFTFLFYLIYHGDHSICCCIGQKSPEKQKK